MRIDRSDLADGAGDAQMTCRALPAPDAPGVAGKTASGGGPPDSSVARPDTATLTERTVAYRAKVDADSRQYAIDQGHARVDVGPRTPTLVPDYDLPEGYTPSPALKRDPYHPDSVAVRSAGNQELYAATSRDRADALGYTTRIPAQKAPFDSHGQEVFTNGKNYITPDVDGHNVTDGWKMFSRRGARIGTYDSELNYVKE